MAGLTGDITKIEVGAHVVKFGASGSEVNLGFTTKGSEITYTPEYVDIMVDQLGNTVVDKRLSGEQVRVTLNLMEVDTDQLLRVMPAASAAATGMDVGRRAGYSIAQGASGVLILHPVELADADKTRDWTIPIAVVASPVTIPNKVDEATTLPIEFQAIANPSADNPKHLLRYGY